MLPSKNRLSLKKDFKRVFKKGRRLQADIFILKSIQNNLDYSRISIVIGAKVIKKSTKRNKLKRIFSSLIEKNFKKIKPGLDLVFIFKKDLFRKQKFKKKIRTALQKDFFETLKKSRILI